MSAKRILLVREKEFHIHLFQLAELLVMHGFEVEVLNSSNSDPEPLFQELIHDAERLGVRCHLVQDRASWLERRLVASAFHLHLITKRGGVTPYKIRETRRVLCERPPFDVVITVDPESLFLACRAIPHLLARIIHYSLEIGDEEHGEFRRDRSERSFRLFERAMLPRVAALLIQDRFRAEVLLRHLPGARVTTIYMPVAINGSGRSTHVLSRPVRVLFFGGLWSESLLRELDAVAEALPQDQILLVQGGRGSAGAIRPASPRMSVSTQPIPFRNVNDFIAQADIGLVIYHKQEPNDRCSAFASEKVARYLQCGIPFVAFDSDDYAYLREQTGCCELVSRFADIPQAVARIVADYGRYQRGAVAAFERFYARPAAASQLLRFLESLAA